MHPYRLPEAPESFPVNALVAIPGTPLEANERVTVQELLRTIATARIVLPTCVFLLSRLGARFRAPCVARWLERRARLSPLEGRALTLAPSGLPARSSIIRFAAGRISYTETEQAMAFMAGANAVFTVRPFLGSRAQAQSAVLTLPFSHLQGERMLTTPTSGWDEDHAMLARWGLKGMGSFESTTVRMKENQKALEATEERKAAAAASSAGAGAAASEASA